MQKGDIRILIGSTFKLGTGVNIQNKLISIHHIDVPWRPADMTQREGRILRQGNENKEVFIYRYIVKGSFDAYSWQLLETKQRFISAILSSGVDRNYESDITDTILNYAEVKAIAIGNPLVKKRVELQNELSRVLFLQRRYYESKYSMEKELLSILLKIKKFRIDVLNCKKDYKSYCKWIRKNKKEEDNSKQKSKMNVMIYDEISKSYQKYEERELFCYKSFIVSIPSNVNKEKPIIQLKNHGKYYIELGHNEKGILLRIDNFIKTLKNHLEKMDYDLQTLIQREKDLKNELKIKNDYQLKIARLQNLIEEYDKELGVYENE